MFHLWFSILIFMGYLFISLKSQSVPIGWRSLTNLSSNGFQFSPINQQALLLSNTTANSLFSCARLCHSSTQCRIFDFDGQSSRCRLFEGNMATMGSIVVSSSSQSRVGSINILPALFINYGQGCSSCQGSRYLTCTNSSCQCPTHTYYDGSICQSQKLFGSSCSSNIECRTDLNYTCRSLVQCGLIPVQSVIIAAGNPNGGSGSGLNALSYPTGIYVGVDNALYVSDYGNQRVLKFPQGVFTGSIVAGTGTQGSGLSQLSAPTGLFVDTSLNIYVADSNNYRVMYWPQNASSGLKVAGTGSSGSALNTFGSLSGLFVDSQGYIYVCDVTNNRIMKFTPYVSNAVIVGGSGGMGSGSSQLNAPYGLYLDQVTLLLYIADYNNNRIQRYQVGGSTNAVTVAGGNGGGTASNQLNSPASVCVSKINNATYIIDAANNRIQRWSAGATSGVTIVGAGATLYNYTTPISGMIDIRLSSDEAYLYVSETNKHRVWRFQLF